MELLSHESIRTASAQVVAPLLAAFAVEGGPVGEAGPMKDLLDLAQGMLDVFVLMEPSFVSLAFSLHVFAQMYYTIIF